MSLAENIIAVLQKIDRAAQKSGRTGKDVRLIAVTKTVPVIAIREAVEAGIAEIGENRVQEAKEKRSKVELPVRWHLVGHLQTNKVKTALELFDLIHSVDSFDLAKEIDRRAEFLIKKPEILIQVNTSFEKSKYGCEPDGTSELVEQIAQLKNIRIQGLMTIGAFLPDAEKVRPSFVLLRELREKIKGQNFPEVSMEVLSMGMSNDYQVAIEEGATMVRIGTAIFGV